MPISANCFYIQCYNKVTFEQLGIFKHMDILLSREEVIKTLGYKSLASLYNLIESDETFPKKIQLTKRNVAYKKNDIMDWIESKQVERVKNK